MKVSFENPDKVNGLLTITVEEEDFKNDVEKQLKDYRKRANINGFRRGQAPMGLIKKQFGASAKMDAINKVVSDTLNKYIQDNKINGTPHALREADPCRPRQGSSLYIHVRHRCCSRVRYYTRQQ